MGLDLVVEGCAKTGCEAEWRRLVERSFGDEPLSDADRDRFGEISTPAYEAIGAPRVGYDEVADQWIIKAQKADTEEAAAAVLRDFHSYYVLRLVQCDGVPEFSNGGLYDGVDETSFRGAFLTGCGDVLSARLIEDAWNHKMPEAAVAYGQALLAAADEAEARGPPPPSPSSRPGFLARLGLARPKPARSEPFPDQLKIVRAAGRWFVFWGERGHPIRAWF